MTAAALDDKILSGGEGGAVSEVAIGRCWGFGVDMAATAVVDLANAHRKFVGRFDDQLPLMCSSGAKVASRRCFLLPRLVMGGNGAGKPFESKKHTREVVLVGLESKWWVKKMLPRVTIVLPR